MKKADEKKQSIPEAPAPSIICKPIIKTLLGSDNVSKSISSASKKGGYK